MKDAAIKLSHNPLGIIVFFILLVDAIVGSITVFSSLEPSLQTILVYFIVSFPIIIFGSFIFLVIKYPQYLYGPKDYDKSEEFLKAIGAQVETAVENASTESVAELAALDIELIPLWEAEIYNSSENSAKKLALLQKWVKRLKIKVANSDGVNKASNIAALRVVLMEYLLHARRHFASGEEYQEIRKHVMEGLILIKEFKISS